MITIEQAELGHPVSINRVTYVPNRKNTRKRHNLRSAADNRVSDNTYVVRKLHGRRGNDFNREYLV